MNIPPTEYCLFWNQALCMPRSDWAAWVQAVMSVAAILAAGAIPYFQHRRERAQANSEYAQQKKIDKDRAVVAASIVIPLIERLVPELDEATRRLCSLNYRSTTPEDIDYLLRMAKHLQFLPHMPERTTLVKRPPDSPDTDYRLSYG